MEIKHIAFIMDGNGRWAQKHGKPRVFGHEAGMHKIEEVCNWCKEFGIKYGSFFAFSKENYSRPKNEVDFIFSLIEKYYQQQIEKLMKNNIKFIHIGEKESLPEKTLKIILQLEDITKNNNEFNLLFLFNYSSRDEIKYAAYNYAKAFLENGILKDNNLLDNNLLSRNSLDFSSFLYTKGIPDPDLLIRTSGEMRISNFLLYQIAYTELYFEKQLWPEYSKSHFIEAIKSYNNRERRFGGLR